MLGDNAEKSKNPLKKAMRRRNAKTVTFSPPTYFEASEVEYSTDEEDDDDQFIEVEEEDEDDEDDEEEEEVQATQKAPQKIEKKEDDMTVEPLRPKQHQQSQKESPASHEERPDTVRKSEDSQMSDDRTGKTPALLTINRPAFLMICFQNFHKGDPEMVWLETRIRFSRMTVLRPRKYPLPPTFFATIQQTMYKL